MKLFEELLPTKKAISIFLKHSSTCSHKSARKNTASSMRTAPTKGVQPNRWGRSWFRRTSSTEWHFRYVSRIGRKKRIRSRSNIRLHNVYAGVDLIAHGSAHLCEASRRAAYRSAFRGEIKGEMRLAPAGHLEDLRSRQRRDAPRIDDLEGGIEAVISPILAEKRYTRTVG